MSGVIRKSIMLDKQTNIRISRRDAVRLLAAGSAGVLLQGASGKSMQQRMLTRPIPSSGESLPVVGLGTWQTFDVGASAAERQPLEEVLALFVKMGGRHIDSSPMYGNSETVAGEIAAKLNLHRALFIATKVWTSGKAEGIRQMEESSRRLRAPRIDLMQVHNLVDVETHLATLREGKAKGRIRYLGITHYDVSAYDRVEQILRRERLDFLQINYSVQEREAEKRLLPLAADRGVAVIINRPFASGALFSRTRGKALPEWAGEIGCRSWAQLFLKFALSHAAVTCAIPATAKTRHLEDNMHAGYGRLPDAKMRERIVEAVAGI